VTTTLTARAPEDLLAVVPVVLGFRPHESLVMLTFGAVRSFHARVDLPPPEEAVAVLPELVDALLEPCLTHSVERAAFISYSADPLLSARVGAALRRAFTGAGVGVVDVLRAHDGTWRRVPRRPGAREPVPTPFDEASHPFAAQAVFEGRVTHASREELRDTLAPDPEARLRVARLQEAAPQVARSEDAAWLGALVARYASARGEPTDAEAARALRAVVHVEVRDAALEAVPPAAARDHAEVWASLLRRAPDPQVPEAAAVTAFCAWQAGHGALAWCALDRCFAVDPAHRLGRCLAECLTRAVPPTAWAEAADLA
jgi:hypothetical protein